MDRRPRVLQICHDFKEPFGVVAKQYAECFSDCAVETIFLRGERSLELQKTIPGEVEFFELEPGALRGLKFDVAAKLVKIIGCREPDIIIAHRYKAFFVGLLLLINKKIPLIFGVMHEYGFLYRWHRSVLSRFWSKKVHLIGVSEPLCQEVKSQLPHLSDRVHEVPNAVEAIQFIDSLKARQELGIPTEGYCFGVVGRLVAKKNHELLLRAFSELSNEAVLAIVGDGAMNYELKTLAKNLGIENRVIFCGHRENARIFMKAFDSLVLPSGNQEAFGMVLLEAMVASIPILSTDAPGPNSIVSDAAITFRSGDKDDLVAKLRQVQMLTEKEKGELAIRGLARINEKFCIKEMKRKIRGIPEIARVVPLGKKIA